MVLFDGGRDNTRHADAVAAHHHRDLRAGVVEYARLHRFRILGAELENMADFDAALDIQRTAAIGTRVAGLGVAQIRHLGLGRVAPPVHAA